jgi:signal transduction histidine kinase
MPTAAVDHPVAPAGLPRWQRLLLSGEVLEREGRRRTARDWAVDLAMFVFAIGAGAFVLLSGDGSRPTWVVAVDIGLGSAACAALWLRRRYPVGVSVFVLLASAVSGVANGAAIPALFSVAIRAPLRTLVAVGALAIAVTAAYPLVYPGGTNGHGFVWQFTIGVAVNTLAMSCGLIVRAQRELLWVLRDRAERAEAGQVRRVREARETERRRIASEMHDALAHRLSLLSVHAGALGRWDDQLPAPLTEAVGVIRVTAHGALEDLRDVIGVLREPEGDAVVASLTVENIPRLVDESRAAGLRVSAAVDVPADLAIPATVSRTAYRVVQEALTNARKHGAGGKVELRVGVDPGDTLVVWVASMRPLRPAPPTAAARLGTGSGLVGLAERVELAGGTLDHGPDPEGNFVVRAALPLGGR